MVYNMNFNWWGTNWGLCVDTDVCEADVAVSRRVTVLMPLSQLSSYSYIYHLSVLFQLNYKSLTSKFKDDGVLKM